MKSIIILLLIHSVFCEAQKTISLDQAYQYSKSEDGIPEDVTYVKDVDNRLDKFTGTWKGSYGDKIYEITFEKVINNGGSEIYWDKVYGKLLVRSNEGDILYNSMNSTISDHNILYGINFQKNVYMLNFINNTSCNDEGVVFIEITKSSPNKMTLFFSRDREILFNIKENCPNYETYVPLLPSEKMILTKQ